jgi:hypothetical protein
MEIRCQASEARPKPLRGFHKICYYDRLGDTVAIAIGIAELCPLTIDN